MKINYNANFLLLEICKNYVQCTFLELLNLNFTLFIKVKCAKKILNPFFWKCCPFLYKHFYMYDLHWFKKNVLLMFSQGCSKSTINCVGLSLTFKEQSSENSTWMCVQYYTCPIAILLKYEIESYLWLQFFVRVWEFCYRISSWKTKKLVKLLQPVHWGPGGMFWSKKIGATNL